jgi:cytochrome c oxidase subunit 2
MRKLLLIMLLVITACSNPLQKDAQKLIAYNEQKYYELPLSGEMTNGVREIELKAYQFGWEPDTIVVQKGQPVRIKINSLDVPHGFEVEGLMIPGWDIDMPIHPGEVEVIEYTPEKEGVWTFICTVYCGQDHSDMSGKFVIKP